MGVGYGIWDLGWGIRIGVAKIDRRFSAVAQPADGELPQPAPQLIRGNSPMAHEKILAFLKKYLKLFCS